MSLFMTPTSSNANASFSNKRVKKASGAGKLNLVSLMDIFTILVFFLMVNTGDVEVLQPDEKVVLPKSFAEIKPDTSPVIKVNSDAIYFKESLVTATDNINQSIAQVPNDKDLIASLYQQLVSEKAALDQLANVQSDTELPERAISVMGDATVPYGLLKRVLYTCAQAGFRDVSLAVEYSSRDLNATQSSEPSV